MEKSYHSLRLLKCPLCEKWFCERRVFDIHVRLSLCQVSEVCNTSSTNHHICTEFTDLKRVFCCSACDTLLCHGGHYNIHKYVLCPKALMKRNPMPNDDDEKQVVKHEQSDVSDSSVSSSPTRCVEKTYNCDLCNQSFTCEFSFAVHQALHENPEKRGNGTSRRDETHLQDRGEPDLPESVPRSTFELLFPSYRGKPVIRKTNFSCDVCHKAFFHRCDLEVHREIHVSYKKNLYRREREFGARVILKCNRSSKSRFPKRWSNSR